jgi:hypothetical protein
MRKILALLAVMAVGCFDFAAADEPASSDGPDLETMSKAVSLLSTGDFKGFDLLIEQSPRTGREHLSRIMKSQEVSLKQLLQDCGRHNRSDLVEIKEVGRVLRRYYFVSAYDESWICWRLSFYRSPTGWLFMGCQWETQEDLFFSEAAHSVPVGGGAPYSASKPETSTPR